MLWFSFFFFNAIDSIWKKKIYMQVHLWIWCFKSCPCLCSNPIQNRPLNLGSWINIETRLSLCSLSGTFCLSPGFLLCFYPYSLFHFSYDPLVPVCIFGCVWGDSYISRWDLVDRPLLRWDHWKTPSILEITGSITGLYTSNVYSIGTVSETVEGVRVVAYVHNSKDKRKEREVSRE